MGVIVNLTPHIKNGVISLKSLREVSPAFYSYLKDFESYKGLRVLDDMNTIRGMEGIKSYLLFYFGKRIDLTHLRTSHRGMYNRLCLLGKPTKVIREMGLIPYHSSKNSDDDIKEKLLPYTENGVIRKPIGKELANLVNYEARKRNMSSCSFLASLGLVRLRKRVKR